MAKESKDTKLSRNEKRKRELLKRAGLDSLPDSWLRLLDESQRIGLRRVSEFETSRLYCSAEWHFARFEGGTYAGLIYSLALRVAAKSGKFFASIPELAKYFDADEQAIREAIHLLVLSGFFQVENAVKGRAVEYWPVPHSDWANVHPGCCINKDQLPYSDGDPLGRALWAICGGQYSFQPNFLKSLRKTGHSDAVIEEHFKQFWPDFDMVGQLCGQKEKRVTKFFLEYLRGQAQAQATEKQLEVAEAAYQAKVKASKP